MGSCPLLFPPVNTGNPPAARRRQFSPPPWGMAFLRRQTAAIPLTVGTASPLTDTAFSAILEIQSTAPPFRFLAAPERK